MPKYPTCVMIIGFDAPIVKTLRCHIKAGRLPNLANRARQLGGRLQRIRRCPATGRIAEASFREGRRGVPDAQV